VRKSIIFEKLGMGIESVHIPVPLNTVCREKNPHDHENRKIVSSSTSILIEKVVDKFKFECKPPQMDQPKTTIKLLKFEIWRHNISEIIFER